MHVDKRERLWNVDLIEGIDPCVEPLRIWVADHSRFTVAICKDFISGVLGATMSRCGVNLIACPSMSQRTDLHEVAARRFAADNHAVSVIANGPQEWGHDPEPRASFVGRPESEGVIVGPGSFMAAAVARIGVCSGEVSVASVTS